uniref:Uncharacterized protein n=1 Tax=Setaria italica TaxID=4555 RepID=A0A0Q3Q5B7_SETIT
MGKHPAIFSSKEEDPSLDDILEKLLDRQQATLLKELSSLFRMALACLL